MLTDRMFNRTTSRKFFAPRRKVQRVLTADFRRYSQIRIRTIHRRDAEYAEEIPFAQSGDDDWAKTFSSNLRNVFVCRRLPTNKKLILCALCASAVIFLKGFLSVSICVNLRESAVTFRAFCVFGRVIFFSICSPNLSRRFQKSLPGCSPSARPVWGIRAGGRNS